MSNNQLLVLHIVINVFAHLQAICPGQDKVFWYSNAVFVYYLFFSPAQTFVENKCRAF